MSYKVAVVTGNNVTIGSQFAPAESFAIYSVRDDFTYAHEENRTWPPDGAEADSGFEATGGGCDDGGATTACDSGQRGDGVTTAKNGAGTVGYALGSGGCGPGGCGDGGGCGSGGCGDGGGGGGPTEPRLERTVAALADVQIVIAGTLGPKAQSALARRGIRAFAVGGDVTKALDKLVAFEKRQHERHAARGIR